MNEGYGVSRLKNKLIVGSLTIIFILVFIWVSGHSLINIQVTGSEVAGAHISVYLDNQNTNKTISIDSATGKVKKIVPKGEYKISAVAGDKNYIGIIAAPSFLRSVRVAASLQPENKRSFVGNNPSACMDYSAGVLASYDCGTIYSSLKVHVPASSSQPTFTERPGLTTDGSIEGFVHLGQSDFVLLRAVAGEDRPPEHLLYQVGNNFQISAASVSFTALNPSQLYSTARYGQGFIIYDSSFQNIFYYPSVLSQPTKIVLSRNPPKNLAASALNTSGEEIAALYSNGLKDKKAMSSVIVYKNGASKATSFNKNYSSVRLCGDNKLCLLGNGKLDVYSLAGGKTKLLNKINGIAGIASSNGLLAIDRLGVARLDNTLSQGKYEYTFGSYSFKGISELGQGYVLRLADSKNQMRALFIDPGVGDNDEIDKKILKLQNTPSVALVSIYNNYIYVSASLGELVYSPSIKSFGYSSSAKKAAANNINLEIDKLHIDRTKYSITSNAF